MIHFTTSVANLLVLSGFKGAIIRYYINIRTSNRELKIQDYHKQSRKARMIASIPFSIIIIRKKKFGINYIYICKFKYLLYR